MATVSTLHNFGLREKAQLMSASEMQRTLLRLAHEIVEKNDGVDGLGLVGIKRRGVPLAERLGKLISRIESTNIPIGSLDITFYRDDLSTVGPKPVVQKSAVGFDIQAKTSSWSMTFFSPAALFARR